MIKFSFIFEVYRIFQFDIIFTFLQVIKTVIWLFMFDFDFRIFYIFEAFGGLGEQSSERKEGRE
jgi:hypothetical protein